MSCCAALCEHCDFFVSCPVAFCTNSESLVLCPVAFCTRSGILVSCSGNILDSYSDAFCTSRRILVLFSAVYVHIWKFVFRAGPVAGNGPVSVLRDALPSCCDIKQPTNNCPLILPLRVRV